MWITSQFLKFIHGQNYIWCSLLLLVLVCIFHYSWNSLSMEKKYTNLCGFISGFFSSGTLVYMPVLTVLIPHHLDYWSYIVSLTIKRSFFPLFFSVKVLLAIVGPVTFHISFRISLSTSTKTCWILIEITLNLRSIWEELTSLIHIASSNPWTHYVSPLI